MSEPAISILLPAYNAAMYIEETISSLLSQTFADFELVIVDDGSTDNTVSIIRSFSDSRIILIENKQNLGLVKTLNKAALICKGVYIARMDADDIAIKERLQLQKDFLDTHPAVAAVAGWVSFINEHGFETGIWDLDRKTNTAAVIKKALLKENCIAHPTVMIRAAVLKEYLYKENQKHIEDYDLWLRLAAGGLQIEKVQQPVLYYRVHPSSITSRKLKKSNFFFKHFNCKLTFIGSAFSKGQFNGFTTSVFFFMIRDLLLGCGKAVKNAIGS